jgi:hypothetical protein
MERISRNYIRVSSLAKLAGFLPSSLKGVGLLLMTIGFSAAGVMSSCLSTWQVDAEDLLEGIYIKWTNGQSRVLTILTEAVIVPGQTLDGKTVNFLQWDVMLHEDGKDRKKILSTSSKGLIRQLLDQDKQKPLKDRTFKIKAVGDGKLRKFEVIPVN